MRRLLLIRKIKKGILVLLGIFLILFTIERIYNSRDEFQTYAEDATNYGIIDAKFRNKEKSRDFQDVLNLLEENYPFFNVNERLNNTDWMSNINRYKRIIRNADNDAEFLVAMNNILGDLNDPNTQIFTGDMYKRYYKHHYPDLRPILHYERSLIRYDYDGTFDLDPNNDYIFHNGPVLDAKILKDNEIAYMKIKAMSYYHIEEDYPIIKNFLEEVKGYDKLIIDIRGNKGGFDEYWENTVKLLVNDVHSAKYYSFFKQTSRTIHDPFKVESISSIRDMDEKDLEKLPEEIKTNFRFYKTNEIQVVPEADIDFKGKVYLLVDDEVYGSAEKFAAFAKDTGFATLVGDTTGGGMIFEEVPIVNLPFGGYIMSYSRELVLNSDNTINMEAKTIPHIVVDATPYEDFTKDNCIQAVMND